MTILRSTIQCKKLVDTRSCRRAQPGDRALHRTACVRLSAQGQQVPRADSSKWTQAARKATKLHSLERPRAADLLDTPSPVPALTPAQRPSLHGVGRGSGWPLPGMPGPRSCPHGAHVPRDPPRMIPVCYANQNRQIIYETNFFFLESKIYTSRFFSKEGCEPLQKQVSAWQPECCSVLRVLYDSLCFCKLAKEVRRVADVWGLDEQQTGALPPQGVSGPHHCPTSRPSRR